MSGTLIPKGGYYSPGPTLVDMSVIANGSGHSWTTGVSATTGGQIGALRLRAQFNFIDGAQGAGSGVMLPMLTGGQLIYVFNRSSSDITIWVAINTTDTIVGVGASEVLPAGNSRTYLSVADGWIEWITTGGTSTGPFLPLGGGQMSGPLNVTATGATAVRSVQDHFGEVINVKDFGARGDGTTDDTAALQAAANTIPATGATLYLPKGTYLISATIRLKSGTRMIGDGLGSVILASAWWPGGTTYELVQNQNYLASTITDHDISVESLQFDYGAMPGTLPPSSTHGAYHAVCFYFARNVQVRFCLFQGRGVMNDATAICASDTSLVEGCVAYGMINASYDHWLNPKNAKVVNCFASGPSPWVFFNPEPDSGAGPGNTADNYELLNCTLVNTGTAAGSCQLEPLYAGATVSNIRVIGNHFVNVQIAARGAVTGAVISNNTFSALASCPGIVTLAALGGTPDGFVIANNVIENPASTSAAPIEALINGAVITGNRITGTAYGSAPGIDTGSFSPVVVGNSISNGTINTIYATSGTNSIQVPNGRGFTWFDASGSPITWNVASDNHMIWFGTDGSGGQRLIMDMYQRSATSTMNWSVPAQFQNVGFHGTAPIAKPTVTGAKGGNAALTSLMSALSAYGLVVDSTS